MTNEQEKWAPVVGYEGLYEASTLGRVRSLPRNTTKGGILSQHVSATNGYCYVALSKNNKQKTCRVHKLVWEAFTGDIVDGYDREKTLNHKDGDKTNNQLNNLERISQRDNQNHAYKYCLQIPHGLHVICLDTTKVYNSATDAARDVGGKYGESVRRVCAGERSHYRGHRYAFYSDYINGTIPEFQGKHKKRPSETLWR
jgi:hypothetical protein